MQSTQLERTSSQTKTRAQSKPNPNTNPFFYLRLIQASWRSNIENHRRCASALSFGPLPSSAVSVLTSSPVLMAALATASVADLCRPAYVAISPSLRGSLPLHTSARAICLFTRVGGKGREGEGGRYSSVACLRHLTI